MGSYGNGGVAFVSVGLPEILILLVLVMIVGFGLWKLAKLLWAAFSG